MSDFKKLVQELIVCPDYGGLRDLAGKIVGNVADSNIDALVDRQKPVYPKEVKGFVAQFRQIAEKHTSDLPETDEDLYREVIRFVK